MRRQNYNIFDKCDKARTGGGKWCWWREMVLSTYLQHSPLDDIISDQSSTMKYCLIKNLAKENPVGKNSSEGKKSAVYS